MEKLEEYFLSLGEKKFKATQIYEWIYQKRIKSFDEVTNIKKAVIDNIQNIVSNIFVEVFMHTMLPQSMIKYRRDYYV